MIAGHDTNAVLFDVSEGASRTVESTLERIPLEELDLAPNPRRDIDPDGIARLAGMLMTSGQLVPVIAQRTGARVTVYAGQRRLLAARASQELAGQEGYEGLSPVTHIVAIMLDEEPTAGEIRRIQAQENRREGLSMHDQQDQFYDCWSDRRGLGEDERMASVCADLGLDPKRGHNLRRQLTLPEEIRTRVAERPAGEQISVTMANRLAEMQEVAPELAGSVAKRITSSDLHGAALANLGAFVGKTLVEDHAVYAVRIEEGELLDALQVIERARTRLTEDEQQAILRELKAAPNAKIEKELDALSARARDGLVKIVVDEDMRNRAVHGRYAYRFERGADFADGVWVIDPVFLIEAAIKAVEAVPVEEGPRKADESYFGAAGLKDEEMEAARNAEREAKKLEAARVELSAGSNLGIGHDLEAGLIEMTASQQDALRTIVCTLVARDYRDVVAYGAGWTDRARQQPVGDSKRHEPRQVEMVVEAELERALADKDPMRGIAQLVARLGAAFLLDPVGVTRTKTLGSQRMAPRLAESLPSGERNLRDALWAFMRPMVSPAVAERNRDAFVAGEEVTSVDLEAHRGDSSLEDLDLGQDGEEQGA